MFKFDKMVAEVSRFTVLRLAQDEYEFIDPETKEVNLFILLPTNELEGHYYLITNFIAFIN